MPLVRIAAVVVASLLKKLAVAGRVAQVAVDGEGDVHVAPIDGLAVIVAAHTHIIEPFLAAIGTADVLPQFGCEVACGVRWTRSARPKVAEALQTFGALFANPADIATAVISAFKAITLGVAGIFADPVNAERKLHGTVTAGTQAAIVATLCVDAIRSAFTSAFDTFCQVTGAFSASPVTSIVSAFLAVTVGFAGGPALPVDALLPFAALAADTTTAVVATVGTNAIRFADALPFDALCQPADALSTEAAATVVAALHAVAIRHADAVSAHALVVAAATLATDAAATVVSADLARTTGLAHALSVGA